MNNLTSTALRFQNNKLEVLDQTKLPQNEIWIESKNPQDMFHIIKNLQVRGAPLIGIAAALSLAQYAMDDHSLDEIITQAKYLKSARPTAVNLGHCLDRLVAVLDPNDHKKGITKLLTLAEHLFTEDKILCDKMSEFGQKYIHSGDTILTHCNTGGLVTTGVGTALGVIIKAHQSGKNISVLVDETRPLLQGGRLTTWELNRHTIPFHLICDNMAAHMMKEKKVSSVFVGADRIALNGDFANKIDTYSLAVLCHYHHIPFYVVAPYTTFDPHSKTGMDIKIENRESDEVCGAKGGFGQIKWTLDHTKTYNPAFDVTPANLVTKFIFDSGDYDPSELSAKLL